MKRLNLMTHCGMRSDFFSNFFLCSLFLNQSSSENVFFCGWEDDDADGMRASFWIAMWASMAMSFVRRSASGRVADGQKMAASAHEFLSGICGICGGSGAIL